MSDPTEKRRKLWTYIHGEEDEEGRLRMQRALSEAEVHRDELSQARRADNALRAFMPGLEQTDAELDQTLENEIMEAWERSLAIENSTPDLPADIIEATFKEKTHPSRSQQTWRRFALGLAACALIAIGLQITTAPSLVWQSPAIIPMEYRGEGTAQGMYTPTQLETLATRLQTTIQQGYEVGAEAAKSPQVLFQRRAWKMHIAIREIAEGALEIRVVGIHRNLSSEPRTWLYEFESADEFTDQADAFGAAVARELVAPIEGPDP